MATVAERIIEGGISGSRWLQVFVLSALLLALTDMVMMRRHRAGDKDAH